MKPNVKYCPACQNWHPTDVKCQPRRAESLSLIIIGVAVALIVWVLIWAIT